MEDFKKSLKIENIIENNTFRPMEFDEKIALSVYMGILNTPTSSEKEERKKANFLLNINRIIYNYDEVMCVLYKEMKIKFNSDLSQKLEQRASQQWHTR